MAGHRPLGDIRIKRIVKMGVLEVSILLEQPYLPTYLLWQKNKDMMTEESSGTNEIELIILQAPTSELIEWDGEAFKKMENLKTLIILSGNFSRSPNYLPNSLRLLEWREYPSYSLPVDFHPKKLAILKLPKNCLTLLRLVKEFVEMSVLDFSWNDWIKHIPDVSGGVEQMPSVSASSTTKRIDLSSCNMSDTFLQIFISQFSNVQELNLSESHFTILPECIKDCHLLRILYLTSCKNLQEIRGIPPNIEILNATDNTSLNCSSREALSDKKLHEEGRKRRFILPGTRIPSWFEHQRSGESVSFWFRNKFPAISLCFLFTEALEFDDQCSLFPHLKLVTHDSDNGGCIFSDQNQSCPRATRSHMRIYDLEDDEGQQFQQNEWNQAVVSLSVEDKSGERELRPEEWGSIEIGVHIIKERSSMDDIQFTLPLLDKDHHKALHMKDSHKHHMQQQQTSLPLLQPVDNLNWDPRSYIVRRLYIRPNRSKLTLWSPVTDAPGESSRTSCRGDTLNIHGSSPLSLSGKASEEDVPSISSCTASSTSTDKYLGDENVISDDDDVEMNAFYASLDVSGIPMLPCSRDKLVTTTVSKDKEAREALRSVQHVISHDASVLLHPELCSILKANLDHLCKLSADHGRISREASKVISEASRVLTHWSRDYSEASVKIDSIMSHLQKADELEMSLESNKKRFLEVGQLNVDKAMSVSQIEAGMFRKRKREIFEEGKTVKTQLDELKKNLPQWEHEHTLAKKTQATIIAEWWPSAYDRRLSLALSSDYGWDYEVFLSFRGLDTGKHFAGNLYYALKQRGIRTFYADRELEGGEELEPTLLKRIQDSKTAIPVFSPGYADSAFCLLELAAIMDNSKAKGRLVFPVFYGVSASDVRRQTGTYEEAMAKHQRRNDHHVVQKWREALQQAANLSGSSFKFHINADEWESALGHYERNLGKEIYDKLKRSFDRLEKEVQSVFLDIACCFKGLSRTEVNNMLRAHHGFCPIYAIRLLEEKSLIMIEDNEVRLHDKIHEMGRKIEQEGKHGHRYLLSSYEAIVQFFKHKGIHDKIEMIILDLSSSEEQVVEWDGEGFKDMESLKTLINRNVYFSQDPNHLPNSLREFVNMRVLNFDDAECVKAIPSLSSTPNLEELSFSNCESLTEIDESVGNLRKLKILNAFGCSKLRSFPPLKLPSIEELNFTSCSNLENFPKILEKMENLTKLELDCTAIKAIPDLFSAENLVELSFSYCVNLIEIDESVGFLIKLRLLNAFGCCKLRSFPSLLLPSLEELDLSWCSSLENFPEILDKMEKITRLRLQYTPIKELPNSIQNLTRLRDLEMLECGMLQLPSNITLLPELRHIVFCRTPNQDEGEEKLSWMESSNSTLHASQCTISHGIFPNLFGWFSMYMEELDLFRVNFRFLPDCIMECLLLKELNLDQCHNLQSIRWLPPNLETLSELREVGRNIWRFVPGSGNCIPEWFHPCNNGNSSVSFWFRNKFTAISLCVFLGALGKHQIAFYFCPKLEINGNTVNKWLLENKKYWFVQEAEADHIFILHEKQMKYENSVNEALVRNKEWNHAKIFVDVYSPRGWTEIDMQIGIHVFKEKNSMKDVQFTNPYNNVTGESNSVDSTQQSGTSIVQELILRSCKSFEVLPSNPTMFQNIEELNVEECPQLPKLLWKLLKDRIDSLPKLSRLTLKSCDLSDEDLELILSCFLQLKWLILSNNSFTTIPDCIEDLSSLLLLHVDNCNQLRDISVLPPDLQYINARNCMSLTSRSSDVILSQAFHEVEYLDIVVLRRQIPKWFDHCCKGGSADFWVRRKFPNIALFFLLGGQDEQRTDHMCEFHLFINDLLVLQGEREWPVDHVWLFDLQIHLTESERHNIREQIKSGWNHVKISCSVMNEPKDVIVKGCGIHLYKERMNIHDVSFISPDLHGSNSAYDNINDDLDFYDETSQDVVFPTVLAKFFPKNIAELLGNLHSGKRTGDDLSDYDEELELDSETDNQSMEVEEEQYSASINLQIPEICKISNHEKETDANSHKILMDPSRGTQEAFVSINEEELKHHKKGKFNKDGIGPESSMTASRRINNGTQVGDKINSGKEINGSSNPHVSENIGLHKSKQKSIILVEANAEAIDINENQVDIYHTHTHFPARIDNGQQSVPNAEAYTSIVESSVNEDNMETFYASLEAETDSESYPHGNQANIVSVITRPSEETKKELQFLRDLVTKKFSLLLHPGRSGLLKDKLKYLLTLPPEEGVSLRTNLLLSQLSTSFAQWSVDYNIASVKLESADKELLRAEKVREELKGNKEEYKGVKMVEDTLRDQLESLEEKKRELEVQINAIKTEIADLSAESNIAAKRKREVFEIAKILRSERDGLRNQVPRLKAEKEWAKVTQVNIEAEWSLLAEQVIGITTFEE
ncbi:hypothetical protein Ahy_A05g023659 isoform A [Arachis hypogaea]|uniref:TIR domain-containing protein n=1 Tax=Arachis hypogaea TaxID=3818 RepID=A0A445D438_ARAHY|nr:hypothetical protein Ahy_A05g023659 isoform A [Arachis hypogaea]